MKSFSLKLGAQKLLFCYRVLFGREETPPRWKFCVSYVNGNLGNAVGAMFVEKYFDENSKHDMEDLTDGVQNVFKQLVTEADWLTNATKVLAAEKIDAIIHNIGYPDFITKEEELQLEVEGVREIIASFSTRIMYCFSLGFSKILAK